MLECYGIATAKGRRAAPLAPPELASLPGTRPPPPPPAGWRDLGLGFGRIAASEAELPNMLAYLVY